MKWDLGFTKNGAKKVFFLNYLVFKSHTKLQHNSNICFRKVSQALTVHDSFHKNHKVFCLAITTDFSSQCIDHFHCLSSKTRSRWGFFFEKALNQIPNQWWSERSSERNWSLFETNEASWLFLLPTAHRTLVASFNLDRTEQYGLYTWSSETFGNTANVSKINEAQLFLTSKLFRSDTVWNKPKTFGNICN